MLYDQMEPGLGPSGKAVRAAMVSHVVACTAAAKGKGPSMSDFYESLVYKPPLPAATLWQKVRATLGIRG